MCPLQAGCVWMDAFTCDVLHGTHVSTSTGCDDMCYGEGGVCCCYASQSSQ